jgi:hypothetical protein
MGEGDAWKISCLLDDQTLRGGDLFAALGAYMQDPSANRTDVTYADVQAHLAKFAGAPAGELLHRADDHVRSGHAGGRGGEKRQLQRPGHGDRREPGSKP